VKVSRSIAVLLVTAALTLALVWHFAGGPRRELDVAASASSSVRASETVPEAHELPRAARSDVSEIAQEQPAAKSPAPVNEPAAKRTAVAAESSEVVVTDRDGHPIAGARVHTFDDSTPGESITDASGRCRIAIVAGRASSAPFGAKAERWFHLRVEADGWFAWDQTTRCAASMQVQLMRAAGLHGRVSDAENRKPVPECTVVFAIASPESPREVARCGSDGSFALTSLPAGQRVVLYAKVDGGPIEDFAVDVPNESSPTAVELLLHRGTEVLGEVIDFATHEPIAGVAILDRGTELAKSGSDGKFAVRIVPSASTRQFGLAVHADGYCWIERDWTSDELAQALPFHIVLMKCAQIDGVVHDASGLPVAALSLIVAPDVEAGIEGRCDDAHPSERLRAALAGWRMSSDSPHAMEIIGTDEAGRFRTSGLAPWMPCFRVASPPNESRRVDVGGGPLGGPGEVTHLDVTVQVLAAGRITGRLLLNGAPVDGSVVWRGASRSGFASCIGDDGRFVLDAVEPGDVTLETGRVLGDAGRTGTTLAKSYVVAVRAGETIEQDLDFVVSLQSVSGRVTTAHGDPAARIFVAISARGPAQPFHTSTYTDANGRWSVQVPVDVGLFTVRASEDSTCPPREGVAPGATGIDFVLPVVYRLRLHVIDAVTRDGIPSVARDSYWRKSGSYGGATLEPDPDPVRRAAGWMIADVAGGSIDVFVGARDRGYVSIARRNVRISSEEAVPDLEVELPKAVGISVHLAASSDTPPEDYVHVALLEPDELTAALAGKDASADVNYAVHEFLGALYSEREASLRAGEPYHVARLRPARYRIVSLDSRVAVEPELVDVQKDGASIQVRWHLK
jgi:hypothetical protein